MFVASKRHGTHSRNVGTRRHDVQRGFLKLHEAAIAKEFQEVEPDGGTELNVSKEKGD